MPTIAELLAREFDRLAVSDPDFRRLRGQARYLGVSPGHLSKLKRGLAPLSTTLIDTFAEKLRPDSREEHERLRSDLLRAETRTDVSHAVAVRRAFEMVVQDFFTGLRGDRVLLCIEYRDHPRAEQDTGRFPQLLTALADAVRAGLTVALFQPFASEHVDVDPGDPLSVYVAQLKIKVRKVHDQVRAILSGDQESNIHNRFMLYEATQEAQSVRADKVEWRGIGSRLFYVERRTDAVEKGVWEWVAGTPADTFVKRDPEAFPSDAFAHQFHEVIDLWRTTYTLPTNGLRTWKPYNPDL